MTKNIGFDIYICVSQLIFLYIVDIVCIIRLEIVSIKFVLSIE